MLPTPLETSEKTLPLLLVSAEDGYRIFSASLKVVQKDFVVQSLKVDSRFVTPPAEVLPRIAEESKKLREIYAGFSQQRHWANSFVRPVPGIITSEFGLKRVFNGEPRSRHKGVDFRAAEGAKIKALAAGTVVFASNTYYSGNLVVIDHGLGVFTSYSHLSATKVKEGQLLEAGQLLGLAGSTGRVTGPHLHLGLIVQGESQTPEPLMPNFRKK
ncbi:M23 family metallopeptidase [Desulfovibrio sp. OttesenSCG-928-F07]|nr:M23 family metallopeptidase [Desulfovibrio sp. OttesenSCG-928-F07]